MKQFTAILGCAGAMLCAMGTADAVETGSGVYVLGFTSPQAGLLPDPGTYFNYNFYSYKASARASVSLTRQVQLPGTNLNLPAQITGSATVDVDSYANILSLTHVFPEKLLGGQPAVGLTVPYAKGDLGVSGNGVLSLAVPGGNAYNIPFSGQFNTSETSVGDAIMTGILGWHDGRLHSMVLLNVYAPTGGYDKSRAVNIGKNHWAFEPTMAVTYLNEQSGLELSGAAGITFNQMNTATDYKSGNELHLDVAAIQHLSDKFYLGLVGYVYNQLTGDSGSGASHAFEGRVYGIGPVIGGVVPLGLKQKLFVNARYYQESGAINRLEGKTLFLTAALKF